jgi:MFS family permease
MFANKTASPHSTVAPQEIAVGVIVGRASEYFDFFVYGIASVLVFPSVFFPAMPALQGQLISFALLALAFVVRPLGTMGGMVIQRNFGTIALLLLGTCTVSIALLPNYDPVHAPWAASLLALCRLGQGLALGASWDGLPSLLALNAPANKRGWYSMMGQLGAPLGLLVAAGLFAHALSVLTPSEFLAWGWRYPFFAAFAINVIALFARLRLVVTHEYDSNLQKFELEPCRTSDLLRDQKRNLLLGAFAPMSSYALFHLVTFFPLSWMVLEGIRSPQWVLTVEAMAAVVCAASMPISGKLADRFGQLA